MALVTSPGGATLEVRGPEMPAHGPGHISGWGYIGVRGPEMPPWLWSDLPVGLHGGKRSRNARPWLWSDLRWGYIGGKRSRNAAHGPGHISGGATLEVRGPEMPPMAQVRSPGGATLEVRYLEMPAHVSCLVSSPVGLQLEVKLIKLF